MLIVCLGLPGIATVDAGHSELVIKDDARPAYLVEPFCFAPGGSLKLEVIMRFFSFQKT